MGKSIFLARANDTPHAVAAEGLEELGDGPFLLLDEALEGARNAALLLELPQKVLLAREVVGADRRHGHRCLGGRLSLWGPPEANWANPKPHLADYTPNMEESPRPAGRVCPPQKGPPETKMKRMGFEREKTQGKTERRGRNRRGRRMEEQGGSEDHASGCSGISTPKWAPNSAGSTDLRRTPNWMSKMALLRGSKVARKNTPGPVVERSSGPWKIHSRTCCWQFAAILRGPNNSRFGKLTP